MDIEQILKELETIKQNQIIIERSFKSLSATVSNNSQTTSEITIKFEREIIDLKNTIHTLQAKVEEISTRLVQLQYRFDTLETKFLEVERYIDTDVREEIKLLKSFSNEIIA